MRTNWHQFWGSGRGPASRLAPQTRILAGAALFAACLTSPARTLPGIAFIVVTALAWTGACGMPRRAAIAFALLGLAMFLPYFLLIPLIVDWGVEAGGPAKWAQAFSAPWDVFLHGLAGMFVATATATTLTASDLRKGLLALPVPGVFTIVLIQIVHQTSELLFETRRVAAAMAVRGASAWGRAALRVLASVPRVWLPRIIGRADRVAAAMELRGYAGTDLRVFGQTASGVKDVLALITVLMILALAIAVRLRGFR